MHYNEDFEFDKEDKRIILINRDDYGSYGFYNKDNKINKRSLLYIYKLAIDRCFPKKLIIITVRIKKIVHFQ